MNVFMKRNDIIMSICFVALAACKNQTKPDRKKNSDNNVKQSVLMQIRSDTTIGDFHNVQHLSKQLKLAPANFGFDSLQIRVWLAHSLAKKKHLIIIQRLDNEWSENLYEISVGLPNTLDTIKDYDKKNIGPLSGWEKLISTLYQLKIQELSDSSASGADGATYSVETLTAKTYTYYNFWEPRSTQDTNWQSGNMAKILAILEREFKFKSY